MDDKRKRLAMLLHAKINCDDSCLRGGGICPFEKRCDFLLSIFSIKN